MADDGADMQLGTWDYPEDKILNDNADKKHPNDISGELSLPDMITQLCESMPEASTVNESVESLPDTSSEAFDFIDVSGKRYTKEDLDKVDDILHLVIGEYLSMLTP